MVTVRQRIDGITVRPEEVSLEYLLCTMKENMMIKFIKIQIQNVSILPMEWLVCLQSRFREQESGTLRFGPPGSKLGVWAHTAMAGYMNQTRP